MKARAFVLSAAVLLAAGCGGAGRAPVFDAIARALPPLAGESKSESKDEAKNESPSAPSSAPASALASDGGGGGFYLDDGPPADSPADLAAIPDAAPRAEPILAARNRPYSALGQNFSPMTELRPYRRRGLASWYGRRYHGRKTSLGETYDMFKMTAAHPTLPLPSYARVTRVDAPDKTVVVRVNDRGPFLRGRIIDLSYAAAAKLGIVKNGVGAVEVELLLPPFADDSPRPSAAPAADAPPFVADSVAAPAALPALQLAALSDPDSARRLRDLAAEHLLARAIDNPVRIDVENGFFKIRVVGYPDRATAERDRAMFCEIDSSLCGFVTAVVE